MIFIINFQESNIITFESLNQNIFFSSKNKFIYFIPYICTKFISKY